MSVASEAFQIRAAFAFTVITRYNGFRRLWTFYFNL